MPLKEWYTPRLLCDLDSLAAKHSIPEEYRLYFEEYIQKLAERYVHENVNHSNSKTKTCKTISKNKHAVALTINPNPYDQPTKI